MRAIFCIDKNGGFGRDGRIPWHVPEDLKHFKKMTYGETLICGRITAEGLPLLKGRKIVPVSRSGLTLEDAIQQYPNAMIIGGAKLLSSAKKYITEMYITQLKSAYFCDTFIDKSIFDGFTVVSVQDYDDFTIRTYKYAPKKPTSTLPAISAPCNP